MLHRSRAGDGYHISLNRSAGCADLLLVETERFAAAWRPNERREANVVVTRRDDGFTLVELMVVVLIIGILIAIAIPVFNAAQNTARERTCLANLRTLDGAVEQWKAISSLDPAGRWGGAQTQSPMSSCGSLMADLSPLIKNWNSAIYCPSDLNAGRHHVTITVMPGTSTAFFFCQGGPGGVHHTNN
jgi:prepilin-type N-terminal cleavage/methylation domain-containing protein